MANDDRKRALELRNRNLIFQRTLRERNRRNVGDPDLPASMVASEETLSNRAALVADPLNNPGLIGIGKELTDIGTAARQIATQIPRPTIEGVTAIPGPVPVAFPTFNFKTNDDEFFRLSETSQENQRLFDILADRVPEARRAEIATTLGLSLLLPTKGGRVTTGTEAAAGGTIAALQPSATPGGLAVETLGGTILGPLVFKISTGITAGGRSVVGGSPSAIQTSADLLQAERTLNQTGLLTTGELRGGRVLQMFEGVMDNIPVAMLGMSGKRRQQIEGFENAVNQVRAAFPDIPEEDVVKLLKTNLAKREDAVQEAYGRVSALAPETADDVQPVNFLKEVDRLLAREKAKGAQANPSVVSELEGLAAQGPVSFQAATDIAGDQASAIRKAKRGATDPAATGLDAGRKKLLSMAWYRDIDAWSKQFPENSAVFVAWEDAKREFVEKVLPFQKRPLAPIFDDQGYDSYSLAKTILTKPKQTAKLAELDENSAMSFLFINELMRKHTNQIGEFKLDRFVKDLNSARGQKGFAELKAGVPKERMEQLNALVKLVNAAPRAFRGTPNILATTAGTGVALGGGVVAGAFGAESEAATAVVTLGFVRFMLGTPAGRAMLTTAARVPANKREKLGEIGRRAQQTFVRFSEVLGTTPETQEEAARLAIQGLPEQVQPAVPSAFSTPLGQ